MTSEIVSSVTTEVNGSPTTNINSSGTTSGTTSGGSGTTTIDSSNTTAVTTTQRTVYKITVEKNEDWNQQFIDFESMSAAFMVNYIGRKITTNIVISGTCIEVKSTTVTASKVVVEF